MDEEEETTQTHELLKEQYSAIEEALPAARHVELECGHVPQVELPGPTHRAMADFLRS